MDCEFGHIEALDLCDQLKAIFKKARQGLKEARRVEQESHTAFLKQYHLLEVMPNFNAAEGFYIAKHMQDTLRERRQAKWDMDAYNALADWMDKCQPALYQVAMEVQKQAQEHQRYLREGPTTAEEEIA